MLIKKYKKIKKGFTLVELLVVVLIISILGAIALPQYQKAVFKARMLELELDMSSLYTAMMDYQLANGKGKFPKDFDELLIGPLEGCIDQHYNGNAGWMVRYKCENYGIGVSSAPGAGFRVVATLGRGLYDEGSYGHFDRYSNRFHCRIYNNEKSRFHTYCKDRGHYIRIEGSGQ